MAVDLLKSLQTLREASAQVEGSMNIFPESIHNLVHLVQVQTSIIEAFFPTQSSGILSRSYRRPTRKPNADSRDISNLSQQTSRPEMIEKPADPIPGPWAATRRLLDQYPHNVIGTQTKRHVPTELDRCLSPETSDPVGPRVKYKEVSKVTTREIRRKAGHKSHRLESIRIPFLSDTGSDDSSAKSGEHALHTADSRRASPRCSPVLCLSPERTWLQDTTPSLPQMVPTFSPTATFTATPISRSRSSSGSIHSVTKCRICQTGKDRERRLRSRLQPQDTDLDVESRLHKVSVKLITAMKNRQKVSIGNVEGTFKLYSTGYRKHHPGKNEVDLPMLSIFAKNADGNNNRVLTGLQPVQEICMELRLDAVCNLVVKSFKVPRSASWKWHYLEAHDVRHSAKSSLEMMFLGNGFIKLKIRLSKLIGSRTSTEEADRIVELLGVLNPPQEESSQSQREKASDYESSNAIDRTRAGNFIAEPSLTKRADSGFYSRASQSGDEQRPKTPTVVANSNEVKRLNRTWSPVSPL